MFKFTSSVAVPDFFFSHTRRDFKVLYHVARLLATDDVCSQGYINQCLAQWCKSELFLKVFNIIQKAEWKEYRITTTCTD